MSQAGFYEEHGGKKHIMSQRGAVRAVALKKGNLGRSTSIEGASHVNWSWPWGNWGHSKAGNNPEGGAANMNGRENLASSRNHSGLVLGRRAQSSMWGVV